MSQYSFEEKINEINTEIAKRKRRWQLSSLAYMDFDDVSQILRAHIFQKWHLWDQSRPFLQWLNKTITHRMINIVRDNYSNLAPPCNGCSFNLGDKHCDFTPSGEKCSECPLYKEWEKKKKVGYNIKLAQSLDAEESLSVADKSSSHVYIDYEQGSENLHKLMRSKLTKSQWKIYDLLIIQGLSEQEVAKRLKFKSSEKGRFPGYKHLMILRKKFRDIAESLIEENDVL